MRAGLYEFMQWRKTSSTASRFTAPRRGSTLARLVLIAVLAVPTGACSSFSSLFTKDEGVAPDEPPEKLYNEGVFLLDKRRD